MLWGSFLHFPTLRKALKSLRYLGLMTSSNLLPRCVVDCMYVYLPRCTSSDQFFRATWVAISQAVAPKENGSSQLSHCAFFTSVHGSHLPIPPYVSSISKFCQCCLLLCLLSLSSPLGSTATSLPWALPSSSQATTDLKRPSGSASPSPSQAGTGLPMQPTCYHSSRLWKQINISWMNGQILNPPLPQTPIYLLRKPSFLNTRFAFSQMHVPILKTDISNNAYLCPPANLGSYTWLH